MSERPAEPTVLELLLEIRDEIVRLRTLLAELRPVPLLPPDRFTQSTPAHSPLCPCAGMWHGIMPPPCTCGAEAGVPTFAGTDITM